MIAADEALRTYLYDRLFPNFLTAQGPRKLNITNDFGHHLRHRGMPERLAAERASEWKHQLFDRLDRALTEWDDLGVPRPLVLTDVDSIVVSWQHQRYRDFCGPIAGSLSADFCAIHERVKRCSPKEFLAVCAIYLKFIGCERIFFTDSSGDEGVDCLGVILSGALKSVNIVVQAKTSSLRIGRDTVLADYGKYLALPHSSKYVHYRYAVQADKRIDGSPWLYVFMTNTEFEPAARIAAGKIGLLLRSRRQIAHKIAEQMSESEFDSSMKRLEANVHADLTRNVWQLI